MSISRFMGLVPFRGQGYFVFVFSYENRRMQEHVFEYAAAKSRRGTCCAIAGYVDVTKLVSEGKDKCVWQDLCSVFKCGVENCTDSQNVWQVESRLLQ